MVSLQNVTLMPQFSFNIFAFVQESEHILSDRVWHEKAQAMQKVQFFCLAGPEAVMGRAWSLSWTNHK